MSIAGNLDSMPLEDLLGWLSARKVTGTLVIDGPTVNKKLVIENGRLTAASSTNPREFLSRYLIGWSYITEEELEHLFRMRDRYDMLVGKLLISVGMLTEEELREILTVSAKEVVFEAFTWPKGSFRFLDGVVPSQQFLPISLALNPLTMEGARRIDEMSWISQLIPSTAHRPNRNPGFDESRINLEEFVLIATADGKRSIEQIANSRREPTFNVLEKLAKSVQRGMVAVLPPDPDATDLHLTESHRELVLRAEMSLAGGRLLDVFKTIMELNMNHGSVTGLAELVLPVEKALYERVAEAQLDRTAVPAVAIPNEELLKLDCGPEQGFILSRVDGYTSTEHIVDLFPGDDDHGRILILDLLDRGVIVLKDRRWAKRQGGRQAVDQH